MEKPTNPKKGSPQKSANSALGYAGLGFQMAVTIGLMTWIGDYLDTKYQTEIAVFTISFSLLGIFASLYMVFKGLIQKG